MPIYYLTVEDVVATHAKTVELSGGGRLGALDLGQLESVLTHIQNDDLYPEFDRPPSSGPTRMLV